MLLTIGWLATALYVWYVATDPPEEVARFFDLFVYFVPLLMASAACAYRAKRSPEVRGIWAAFALGLLLWLAGDVYWTVVLEDQANVSYPSLADAGYLLALPCLFAGVALIAKYRIGRFSPAAWLDGGIAALAFACVGAALLAPALVGLTAGNPAVVATNLSYPAGDLILLAFLVGVLTVGGTRASGSLLFVTAGLVVWGVTDATYLYLTATDSYAGGWIDLFWLVGALTIATGAAMSPHSAALGRHRSYEPSLIIPMVAAMTCVAVLIVDHFERLPLESIVLGGATLIAVAARLIVSAGENRRLVDTLSHDSITDPLTGLGNRRRLFDDLERVMGGDSRNCYLALFDLDGFKGYNDAFGHSLGDALLRNLGHRLNREAQAIGCAYRLGGDEFCVLIEGMSGNTAPTLDRLRSALSESGESFEIGASFGLVYLHDTDGVNEALRLADQRMYAEKGSRARRNELREAHDVLLSVQREHEPALEGHIEGVGERARAVAAEMDLEADQIETIARAAELHDIGKVAIPDSVLRKPGPLNEEEWALMREHTLIGERILATVRSLRGVGRLVRSSHERWDGRGYPDGLTGEEIPLGSRIVFVCDAFEAMTENRAYQQARTQEEALAELHDNAGGQFDPEVVEAFTRVHVQHRWEQRAPSRRGRPGLAARRTVLSD